MINFKKAVSVVVLFSFVLCSCQNHADKKFYKRIARMREDLERRSEESLKNIKERERHEKEMMDIMRNIVTLYEESERSLVMIEKVKTVKMLEKHIDGHKAACRDEKKECDENLIQKCIEEGLPPNYRELGEEEFERVYGEQEKECRITEDEKNENLMKKCIEEGLSLNHKELLHWETLEELDEYREAYNKQKEVCQEKVFQGTTQITECETEHEECVSEAKQLSVVRGNLRRDILNVNDHFKVGD